MFSPAVKAEQTRLGSRAQFEDREWKTEITDDLRQFLAVIDTFFFATASADGRPYIQHRGGPPGFLKPIGTPHAGLRRFRRQPAVHHARPSQGERPRPHLHPAFRHPAARQAVGPRPRGRGRPRTDGAPGRPDLQGQARTRDRLHARSLGRPIARSTSCRATARLKSRPPSTGWASGSRNWKRKWRGSRAAMVRTAVPPLMIMSRRKPAVRKTMGII